MFWRRIIAWAVSAALPLGMACQEQKRPADLPEDPDKVRIDQLTLKIKTYPDSAGLYEERSAIFYRRGQAEKAVADISQAIRLRPQDAELYYIRGVYFYSGTKNDTSALSDFLTAERLGSDNPEVFAQIGNIHTLTGNYDAAVRYYRKAESLDSLSSHYPFVRAFSLYQSKKHPEALEACSLSLRLDSANVNAANLLFEILFEGLNQPDKALAANRLIFKTDSLHPLGFFNLGLWHFRRYEKKFNDEDLKQADRYYSRAIVIDPGFAAALYNRGYIRFLRKDFAPALTDFERCVRLDSTDARAHFHIGLIYEKYNDRLKAKNAFEKALRHAPEFHDARKALARLES
jgi:tetratricopeptide (TPR) repeat protein